MGQELMSRMALVYAEIESIQCNNDDPYRHSKRSAKHAATRILEDAIGNAMNVVQLANIIASDQRDEEKAKPKDTQ